jgi:hypothetical protein
VTQIVAALILAGGAFFGVYKGAVYAVDRLIYQLQEERRLSEERLDAEAKRLEMQLDAESDRLARQLDAESERLDRQLSADRDKQDRAELREILDEGAILLAQALARVNETQSEVETPLSERPTVAEYQLKAPLSTVTGFEQLSNEIDRYWQRLMLRFRVSDDIPKAVSSARQAFDSAMAVLSVKRKEIDDEKIQQFNTHRDVFEDKHAEFLLECRRRFGIKEPA